MLPNVLCRRSPPTNLLLRHREQPRWVAAWKNLLHCLPLQHAYVAAQASALPILLGLNHEGSMANDSYMTLMRNRCCAQHDNRKNWHWEVTTWWGRATTWGTNCTVNKGINMSKGSTGDKKKRKYERTLCHFSGLRNKDWCWRLGVIFLGVPNPKMLFRAPARDTLTVQPLCFIPSRFITPPRILEIKF